MISDIHGNRQALEAVLAEVAESGASETWCLGDLVGYGADPTRAWRSRASTPPFAWPATTISP